jgi:ubiquinone biosynthesis protein
MIRAARNLARLVGIARTLARYDALEGLEALGVMPALTWSLRRLGRPRRDMAGKRLGERLAAAAQALGPSFIKLGQALSTRADLLGEECAGDLARLRDRLPPFPGSQARDIVARELGHEIDELFESFDEEPVAAASIAQVHFAVTSDGREVAVKVLRPDIEKAFTRDLELLFWLARLIERTQPKWHRLRPVAAVQVFADVVAVEMDLRLEGAAAAELAENFADDPGYRVPAVDWPRTARRVLTTERVHGIPIDRRDALIAAGHDLDAVLEIAARATFNQVFRDGFFHGDPHPGNVFVDADGRINVVDFGIMGRLDRDTRRYLAEMLLGFLTGDYARVAEVHFRAGYVPADKSVGAFTQACRSIGEPIMGLSAGEISVARLLAQLFQITETFGMATQPHLLLLQKVLMVSEGVGRGLNPDANMWQLARPLIEDWAAQTMGPEARVRAAAEAAINTAQRLPRLLARGERMLDHLAAGQAPNPGNPRRPAPGPWAWPLLIGAALLVALVVLAF